MFTTAALYYVKGLGLNPFQLVLVGTALELTIVLLEVPTGVIADSYSRRLSVIIGCGVLGLAYLLEGSIPVFAGLLPFFAAVLVAEVIRGVGETFLSGATEAWITDEVGEDRVGDLFLRAERAGRLAQILGVLLSGALATVSLNLPYLVGGALLLILVGLLLAYMPEDGFKPNPHAMEAPWRTAAATFRDGVGTIRGRPILIGLLVVTLISGAASEGIDRLWEAHFLITLKLEAATSIPLAFWFSGLALARTALALLTIQLVRPRLNLSNHRSVAAVLVGTSTLRLLGLLAFAAAPSYLWAIAALLTVNAVGAIRRPVYQTWANQQIDSRVRATVLSMIGQMDAIGQSGGGPIMGWVGTRFSLRAALALAALLQGPAVLIFGATWRRVAPKRASSEGDDAS